MTIKLVFILKPTINDLFFDFSHNLYYPFFKSIRVHTAKRSVLPGILL